MNQLRQQIVDEAMTWIGTPFVHEQCLKGVGVDCATLIASVYYRALGVKVKLPHYDVQWNLHCQTQPYLEEMLKHAKEVSAMPQFEYVSKAMSLNPRFKGFPLPMWNMKPPEPGDLGVWWFGRGWAHTTIVIDWPIVLNPMMHSIVTLERAEVIGSISQRGLRMRLLRAFQLL